MSEHRSRFDWQDFAHEYSFPVLVGLILGMFTFITVQAIREGDRRDADCTRNHGAIVSRVCVDSSAIHPFAP